MLSATMADLYTVFDLASPAPPTAFSFDHDDMRARFPNFLADPDPAQACRDFMHKIIRPQMPRAYIPQYFVLGAIILVLLLVALGVIAVRIYNRQFWLFRCWQKPGGTMFSFNSTK